ncbi:hypothetical protein HY477_01680 [Candidatus Uhrbacteria bacterium]|nr:hypothetical protein [Candidatus Uhrbacteria bacterium]
MTIPLVFLLIPYAVIIGLVILFSFVNLYHLLHYGFFYFSAALFTYLFYGAVAIILFWAYQELSAVNWSSAVLIIGS